MTEYDPLIDWMVANKVPVTRSNYIGMNWDADAMPDPWTPDHEEQLPEKLQRWDWFKVVDGELIYTGKVP